MPGRDAFLAMLGELSSVEIRVIETVGLILFLVVLRALILFIVRGRIQDHHVRYHWRKGITYALTVIGIFGVARVWFVGVGSVATFLGLVGAGLVIALKEPLSNLAAWLFVLWRRPFVIGDRIQIGTHAGDVIDQGVLLFSILEIGSRTGAEQSTGRVIHIPNGRVFLDPVANFTRGFPYLWNEVDIVISFESNWHAAKELLHVIAERHGHELSGAAEEQMLAQIQRFMIFYSTLAPTVYTRVVERGVQLTIRYLCEARRRRVTEHLIWESVLQSFAERDDIDFAYPTQRFFDRHAEQRTLQQHAPGVAEGLEL